MVVPNSYMWRCAAIAYFEISVCPNGASNCTGPRAPNERFALRRRALRSARVVEPYTRTTTSTWPAWIAAVGVLDHELPRRAADAGAVDPRRPQPEVLGDLDRREQPHAARAEAVDVGLREPGVGDRTRRGLVVQFERRLRVDPPDVRERRADRARLASCRHRYLSFHSTRLPDENSCWPSAIESWFVPIATYA